MLEVRALDSEHVYIRVAWLNRPEDLSAGRKAYHGKFELIPTNQMDIIDAMTVNGPCDVVQWDEKDDDSPALADVRFRSTIVKLMLTESKDQFFWRHTYDHVGTKTFSELRKICVDNAPVNPDELILCCGNQECKKWQHIKCIAEAAVQDAGMSLTFKALLTITNTNHSREDLHVQEAREEEVEARHQHRHPIGFAGAGQGGEGRGDGRSDDPRPAAWSGADAGRGLLHADHGCRGGEEDDGRAVSVLPDED